MEHFFAVYKIIEVASEIFEDGSRLSDEHEAADITRFVPCLVDDLRIRNRGKSFFYQLKSGRAQIEKVLAEVKTQTKLDEWHKIPAEYFVVVRSERRKTLFENRSLERGIEMEAILFHFERKWPAFVELHPYLRIWLMRITGAEDENTLEKYFRLISAKWMETDDGHIRHFILEFSQRHHGQELKVIETTEA